MAENTVKKIATRESYGNSLKELAEEFPNLVVFPENTVSICVIPYGETCGRQSRQVTYSLLK